MVKKRQYDIENLKNLKVLCVEDQEFILQQLAMLVGSKVKEVFRATNGLEGLKIFKQVKPDIVITDIEMPELNGLELTKQIKSINPAIPVIITTAYNDIRHLSGAFEVGADNFLTKPVDMNRLFHLLSNYGSVLRQKRELIAMQKKMENIANSMGEGLFVINTKGDLQYMNFAAINITGYELNKRIRINLSEIIDQCSADGNGGICKILMEKTMKNLGSFISDNVVFRSATGELKNVTLVSTPLIERDKVKGAVLIFRDITEEIKKSMRLKMLAKAVNSSHVSFVLLNLSGEILEINNGFSLLAGLSTTQLDDRLVYGNFLKPKNKGVNPFDIAVSMGKWQGEMVLKRADGSFCPVEAVFSLILDDEGKPLQVLVSVFDISVRKRAEEAMLKAKAQELELYKYRERYHSLQQEYAFKKQAKIIRDDLSNKRLGNYFIETYFKPLDVLSGDIYGSIDGGEGRFLFYIIDAMGKGLSASVTSTQSSSFINHAFGTAFTKKDFLFQDTVTAYVTYIKKQLLDDELLCVSFVYVDFNNKTVEVANYGMPPLMYQTNEGEVVQIPSNNPPIMKFFSSANVDKIEYDNIRKLMIYSDGLDEHVTKEGVLYIEELQKDFKESVSKKDFFNIFDNKIVELTDDITSIFLFKVEKEPVKEIKFEIESNPELLDLAVKKIIDSLNILKIKEEKLSKMSMCLNELVMNAIEHGNLGVSYDEKQLLVEKGEYEGYLKKLYLKKENKGKKIRVVISKFADLTAGEYALVDIKDEGDGFNSSGVFKNLNFSDDMIRYHGRGIAMSQLMTDGIFYNQKGNKVTVLIINK